MEGTNKKAVVDGGGGCIKYGGTVGTDRLVPHVCIIAVVIVAGIVLQLVWCEYSTLLLCVFRHICGTQEALAH
jgi:hypothetical protein